MLSVVVEYDGALTDPDTIASYLDLVLDAAHESLDQCGPLAFGEVRPVPELPAWARPVSVGSPPRGHTPCPDRHGSSHTYPDHHAGDGSTDD